jgi:hypothetical protein
MSTWARRPTGGASRTSRLTRFLDDAWRAHVNNAAEWTLRCVVLDDATGPSPVATKVVGAPPPIYTLIEDRHAQQYAAPLKPPDRAHRLVRLRKGPIVFPDECAQRPVLGIRERSIIDV